MFLWRFFWDKSYKQKCLRFLTKKLVENHLLIYWPLLIVICQTEQDFGHFTFSSFIQTLLFTADYNII